jgi:Na+-exporting ATPase
MQDDAKNIHPRSREGPMFQQQQQSSPEHLVLSSPAYLLTAEEIVQQLATDTDNGLSEEEAQRRITKYGLNELEAGGGVSAFKILMGQIFNAMVLVTLI